MQAIALTDKGNNQTNEINLLRKSECYREH